MNQDRSRIQPDLASPFNPQSRNLPATSRGCPLPTPRPSAEQEIRRHADLAARLNDRNPVEVAAEHIEEGYWRVTIVAYDYLGELSVICGLLFAHGFSIVDGHVFTYEAGRRQADGRSRRQALRRQRTIGDPRRKIVDVFTVDTRWLSAGDGGHRRHVAQLRDGPGRAAAAARRRRQREAQGELAKRVAVALRGVDGRRPDAPPDRHRDRQLTLRSATRVLRIEAPDTARLSLRVHQRPGLNGIHIAQVSVATDRQPRARHPLRHRRARPQDHLAGASSASCGPPPCWSNTSPTCCRTRPTRSRRCCTSTSSWASCSAGRVARRAGLAGAPRGAGALARLLGVSDFLWDDFLRMQYANLFPVVQDVDALATGKTRAQLASGAGGRAGRLPPTAGRTRATGSTRSKTARCSASTCATSWGTSRTSASSPPS